MGGAGVGVAHRFVGGAFDHRGGAYRVLDGAYVHVGGAYGHVGGAYCIEGVARAFKWCLEMDWGWRGWAGPVWAWLVAWWVGLLITWVGLIALWAGLTSWAWPELPSSCLEKGWEWSEWAGPLWAEFIAWWAWPKVPSSAWRWTAGGGGGWGRCGRGLSLCGWGLPRGRC